MNSIRQAVGELFGSSMQNMSFLAYFQYVNSAGKITARSLMELIIVALSHIEEQEKKNLHYEENFNEIQGILEKLVQQKVEPTEEKDFFKAPPEVEKIASAIEEATDKDQPKVFSPLTPPPHLSCPVCKKVFNSGRALNAHKLSHNTK